MKSFKILFICMLSLCLFSLPVSSQINPLRKIRQKTNEKINKEIDKAFDKTADKKDKEEKAAIPVEADSKSSGENPEFHEKADKKTSPELIWAKYDFIPGNQIIFEDNLFGEENGEFPSRWDLFNGTAEVAKFGDDDVIMFRGNATGIVPYLKNPEKDYLPEVFTIEFDMYKPGGSFTINLYDRKNQKVKSNATYFTIWSNSMECHSAKSNLPNSQDVNNKWVHIAIAYTNGKLKGYIDETRLINIPHLEFNPSGLTLYCYHASDNNRVYLKNVRIAEGGVKYYDRFLQDGKIISNGIRFETGKADLRPESMGAINEIFNLLSKHEEIRFSIEGHTDSDGDFELNQKLSEDRAKTVMNQLISMGIDKNRLSSKGFGESKPLNNNSTPEGKAENRRVEFIKLN